MTKSKQWGTPNRDPAPLQEEDKNRRYGLIYRQKAAAPKEGTLSLVEIRDALLPIADIDAAREKARQVARYVFRVEYKDAEDPEADYTETFVLRGETEALLPYAAVLRDTYLNPEFRRLKLLIGNTELTITRSEV